MRQAVTFDLIAHLHKLRGIIERSRGAALAPPAEDAEDRLRGFANDAATAFENAVALGVAPEEIAWALYGKGIDLERALAKPRAAIEADARRRPARQFDGRHDRIGGYGEARR